ncbi:MAG: two-component sensor histidine kinase, partial [Actinomycetota bacterium]|nr:two-component sensor histidine kinase [Actinomycetota bacterium]
MSAPSYGFRPQPNSSPPVPSTKSVSLRWRVMLLAMSMVAMVVVLMAVAVWAVVSRALYDDVDNQLRSRARLLIESGSLQVDPSKAIEGTAYSDV